MTNVERLSYAKDVPIAGNFESGVATIILTLPPTRWVTLARVWRPSSPG